MEDREKSGELNTFQRINWSRLEDLTEIRHYFSVGNCEQVQANDGTRKYMLEDSTQRSNRLICYTDNGLLGNVPQSTLAGDIIVVLFGAKVPHVLRPRVRGPRVLNLEGEIYKLIGEW